MIDNVRKSSSDCNIMVSALSYRTHEVNGKYNQKIDKFNGALRMLCPSYKNCTFHEFNPVAVRSNLKEDGLHFNRNGSVTFAKQLANIMKNFYMVLNQTKTYLKFCSWNVSGLTQNKLDIRASYCKF